MPVRRDRIPLTTPIARPNLQGLVLQRDVDIDLATGTIRGYLRFYSPAGKFLTSEPFEIVLQAAGRNAVANLIMARVQAQRVELAGTPVSEDVADPDQDV